MLLGIAYHVSLSFAVGFPWMVQDTQATPGFYLFNFFVHGFRMPLFFLLSGFFTAMLWRKRGLAYTAKHRVRRIFLPLVLGAVTIVPLMGSAIGYAMSFGAESRSGAEGKGSADASFAQLWEKAPAGDLDALDRALAQGFDINQPHPMFQSPLLIATALADEPDLINALLERGADINGRGQDGGTALHAAAFFGKARSAQALIDAGADTSATNNAGDSVISVAQVDWGITKAIADMIQVPVERKSLEAGRIAILEALGVPTDPSSERTVSEKEQSMEMPPWVGQLFVAPVFAHLWFLAFLCWLMIAFALYAWVSQKMGWSAAPRWLTLSPWGLCLWIALTCLPQALMGIELAYFGPDTSVGLLPYPHVLAYYALFFFFGVFYFETKDSSVSLGHSWKWSLPLTLLILFPFGISCSTGFFPALTAWIPESAHRTVSVVTQAAYAWLASIGFMGLFHALLKRENQKIRYLSDASYWLYLAHLPLVFIGQAWVRDWQAPALLKFSLVTVILTVVLLLSYHYLVRYTPIGRLLNGRRDRPAPAAS